MTRDLSEQLCMLAKPPHEAVEITATFKCRVQQTSDGHGTCVQLFLADRSKGYKVGSRRIWLELDEVIEVQPTAMSINDGHAPGDEDEVTISRGDMRRIVDALTAMQMINVSTSVGNALPGWDVSGGALEAAKDSLRW